MRPPSARVLINRASLFPCAQAQDADGGVQFSYPGVPSLSNEPCSAQPVETVELTDEQGRLIRETTWKVMFGRPTGAKNRDKLVISQTGDGLEHTAFARIEQDQAGRGAAYVVHAVERV